MPGLSQLRIAVIGAGPRGLSVLERLVARATRSVRPISIDLIDPYPPGSGAVWRYDQSPLFLMNTQSFFPTVVPDRGVTVPAVVGTSFDNWRKRFRPELSRNDFPPRKLYGEYLHWVYTEIERSLPQHIRLVSVRSEAKAVRRSGTSYTVSLVTGERRQVDAVVLALGHVPAKLSSEQAELANAAHRRGLSYQPPALPADVDWSRYPAKETVLIRGMGLNFFDLLAQWTLGRGGSYRRGGNRRLEYHPSGNEPIMVAASRRGGPYRAKADWGAYYPPGLSMPFLSRAIAEIKAPVPGFDHDLWPGLHKDVIRAYYQTLLTQEAPGKEFSELEGILAGEDWQPVLEKWLKAVPNAKKLDLRRLARPFEGSHFTDREAFSRKVVSMLDADAAGSASAEQDPLKMAIGALNRGRAMIKEVVADGGITEASWIKELRGWFEGFVEGLASGPPRERIEQLAAVARAGLIRFVGPDPVFGVDDQGFWAKSPWVNGVGNSEVRSQYLVEAMAPTNSVAQSASPLVQQLLNDGMVRPRTMLSADGTPVRSSGLDVSEPPYRALTSDGQKHSGLYVIGLQLSAVQWGTAIAAQAESEYPSGYRTLVDADRIAADILD